MELAVCRLRLHRLDRFRRGIRDIRRRITPHAILRCFVSFFPIVDWLPRYDIRHSFLGDLSGGLTMAVFCVPQGIALAAITGVDPVYGLYTAIFPSFFYIIFGTSKHNSLGGFAVLSLMTNAAIEKVMLMSATSYNATYNVTEFTAWSNGDQQQNFTETLTGNWTMNNSSFFTDTDMFNVSSIIEEVTRVEWTAGVRPVKPIHVATTIIFLSGTIQILMGIFRLEFLTSYFSEQVMSGFVVGAYIHVIFAQIGDILGVKLPRRAGPGYLFHRAKDLINCLPYTQWPTVIISVASMVFLIFGKEYLSVRHEKLFKFPVPYEFMLVILGITATNYADLSNRQKVSVVGNIPTNFPPPSLPRYDLIPLIAIDSVSIAAIAVAIHITVAKIVEKRYEYKIRYRQELYALGFVGVLSSFFPVFPVTSGFARSVIGAAVGGSTQLTSLFSALVVLAVILYIGPVLEYLPKCILAAMVLVQLKGMFVKMAELKQMWPTFKVDFLIWVVSLLLTVCYDMAEGLAIAIIFAILTTVVRNQWPRWHFLTDLDNTGRIYRETSKKDIDYISGGACVFRMDGPLIFTSIDRFTMAIHQCIKHWQRKCAQRRVFMSTVVEEDAESIEKNCTHQMLEAIREARVKRQLNTDRCSLVIDCSGFPYVDYMGLSTLKMVYTDLTSQGVTVHFAAARGELLKTFEASNFYKTVDRQFVFCHVHDAVLNIQKQRVETTIDEKINVALEKTIEMEEEPEKQRVETKIDEKMNVALEKTIEMEEEPEMINVAFEGCTIQLTFEPEMMIEQVENEIVDDQPCEQVEDVHIECLHDDAQCECIDPETIVHV